MDPSGAGEGAGTVDSYCSPPPSSFLVLYLRPISPLGTSWQVLAPAVRTRGTLPVRAVKMKLLSFPIRSDAPTWSGGLLGADQAVLPRPPASAPPGCPQPHTAPELTQPSFLSGPRPKPRPRQQDLAHQKDHQLQKRQKHPHQDPRTIVTLRGNSQVRV